jgi:hypothetical protein
VYVKITENGLKLLSEIDENALGTSLNNIGLSDEESNTLSDLLDKVRLNFE